MLLPTPLTNTPEGLRWEVPEVPLGPLAPADTPIKSLFRLVIAAPLVCVVCSLSQGPKQGNP